MKSTMQDQKGFTIVELLIVIVVIAILAAISIVAYNGIQSRAENTKSLSAVSSWAKGLQLYKIHNGDYPNINTCLGDTNTYTDSHGGVCWGSAGSTTWVVQPTFLAAMKDFIGTNPAPSSKNVHNPGYEFRGAMYYIPGGPTNAEIRVSLLGVTSTANCPSIGGLNPPYASNTWTNGSSCYYRLPQ